ncbi:MAG TPA: C39 family peptidase [Candidatus Dormibacteraeota bacterium]
MRAIPLLVLVITAACGAAASASAPLRVPPPTANPGPSAVAAPAGPVAPTPAPTAAPPAPVPLTFSATIVHAPGARVRSGPGLDQPVLDIDRVGRTETFDGWFQRADDQPLPDEVTGRIEPWSRDWFHLADGRGWVHSASVRGNHPDGMPQRQWTRPGSPANPAAGLIEIPAGLQQHPVTCELASLKMALAGRGIAADELSLLALTGDDRRPAEADGSGDIRRWGDPNQVFVGDPDGHISAHTGYGVYAAPIAAAARRSGASVVAAGTGIAPAAVYAAVIAGHPAVAWVTNDYRPASVRTWVAWDGSTVQYALNEHAVLVVGVTPGSILVNDPMKGQVWLTRTQFEAGYATFDDMAVVIR